MIQTLILIRGAQGSGKSTLAKELMKSLLAQGKTFAHYENDMYFMDPDGYRYKPELHWAAKEWCQQKVDQAFKDQFSTVIVSNTFTSILDLVPYFMIGFKYQVKLVVYHCKGEFESSHEVPKEVIEKARAEYESLDGLGLKEIVVNEGL